MSSSSTSVNYSYDCIVYNDIILPKLYGYSLASRMPCCSTEAKETECTGSLQSNTSQITKIILANYQLNGFLPQEMFYLTSLQGLYLNNNSLHGPIPSQWPSRMTNMTWLHLENNLLDSTIPIDIDKMSNLQDLFLNNNSLVGNIPSSLGNIRNLTQLYLQGNFFTGSLPFISQVPNSTYQFAPQRTPPPPPSSSPQGSGQLSPASVAAILSSLAFFLVVVASIFGLLRYRKKKNEQESGLLRRDSQTGPFYYYLDNGQRIGQRSLSGKTIQEDDATNSDGFSFIEHVDHVDEKQLADPIAIPNIIQINPGAPTNTPATLPSSLQLTELDQY